ncbi:remodeling and spacing factor 1-like [Adelges cooleyi]|uniref:remodeling and spacing factor 1-like n=1 Tax=Adelges cooleyi TaxID=133065 RepID=UPI0021801944|nr:remodeling and spacing factor 1-like [Adelges cooleyi]
MATSPVAQVQDVCASDPNFAVIFAFCERFGNLCGVDIPTFQELQEMLEKTNEVPSALVDLHVKLLRKVKKSVHADKWEKAIIKFCQTYSIPESWEVECYGYKGISTQLKLKILKNLFEAQFDSNVKFKAEINKLESSALRSQPLGWDKQGIAYWAQFDRSCNLRVYKEDIEEDTWNIVARDRGTLVNFINELSGTNDKLLDEEVEDSNSIESTSEIEAELSPGLDQEKDDSSSTKSDKNGDIDFNVNNLENKTNELNVPTTNFKRKFNEESEKIFIAGENLSDPIVGEVIEESVMMIKGEGTGQECDTGNPGENEPHEENTKADEVKKPKLWSIETICSSSKEVQEEIIPVPKTGFFFGDDSVPCLPNIENEDKARDKTENITVKETVNLNEKNESHDTKFDNLEISNKLLDTDSKVVLDKVEDLSSKMIPKQSVFNITIHEKEIQITEQNSNEALRNAEKSNNSRNYENSETNLLQKLSNDSEHIKESTEKESKIECNRPTEVNIIIDNQLIDQNCSNANNTNIENVYSDQSNLKNTTKNLAFEISSQSTSSDNKTVADKKNLNLIILDKNLIDTVEQDKKIDIKKSKNVCGINECSNVESIIDESKTENNQNEKKVNNFNECVKVDNLIAPTGKISSFDKTDISILSKYTLDTNDQFIETKKELENISDQSYESAENKLHDYSKNLKADNEKTGSAKYENIINCNAVETNKPLSFRHSENEKSSSNNKCKKEANSEIKNEISELDYNNKHTIDNLLSNLDDNGQNTDNNYSSSSKLDKNYAEWNKKKSENNLMGQKLPVVNLCDKLKCSTDELEVENKNSPKDPVFDNVDKNSEITSLGNNNNNKKGNLKNESSSIAQQKIDKPCSTVMYESNDNIKETKVIDKKEIDHTLNKERTNFSKDEEDFYLSVDCKNETDVEDSPNTKTEKNDTPTIPERLPTLEMPVKIGEQFEEKSHKTKEFNSIEKPKKRRERKKSVELEEDTESVSLVLTNSLEAEECLSQVNTFEGSDKPEKDIEKIDNEFNDDEQADDNEEYEQNSEKNEESPKKVTKPVGRKKRKRGKAKKIIVKKVNKDNEEEKVKKPRKPRQKKVIPLVEEVEIKPEENESQDNIRRSRRIAEIKIKEQVLPSDIYDNDDDSKSSTKKEKGRKKNIQTKKVVNLIQSDDEDDEDESTINKKSKKRRKKGKTPNLKGLNKKNPWNVDSDSSSSDNNAEEFDDYYHEEEDEIPRPGIEPNVSDHEFSPESDINEDDEEYLPEKRARTAHKKSQGEQIIDDMPCQNCNKSDHPDWILLCDTCNQGWHASCLRPALMVIPDGDWYCPPCRHESLLNSLKATLKKFDSEAKKRENEELRRKRLAYVGISLQNVISTKIEDTKSKQSKNDATSEEEEEEDDDGDESEASDSNDSEPLYKLRARRQTNVSYRFNDYDDMINEAISGETGNEVTDISKTSQPTKEGENENSDSENEFSKPEGSPIAPALLHLSRRRKSKKLTNLDVTSDDDSDDDFKGPSEEEDEDEEEGSEYSDDSVRKRPQPTRRSVRNRRTVVDPDFINDDTSDESDHKKKKKRTREWSESEDSEEEDITWGKRAKKRANVSSTFKQSKVSKRKRKANDNYKVPGRPKIQYGLDSDSESDGKPLRKTRKKQVTYAESDDSEEEVKPKRSKALSDDEDEYVLNDDELDTEKDDINEDADDIEDEDLPKDDEDKEETSTTPVQRIATPVKSPQQADVPVQKPVKDELPLADASCDPPQVDIVGNHTSPNQRILPIQLVTDNPADNKKETVSSRSQKSPTAIDFSAYPYSPEKVAIPPPTHAYPVPPRLPVQAFVNKQVSSPVLPVPYTGYRNKIPINPAPYGPIPQGQQVYHAPGSFSYPVDYGNTAALHHQQRPLPQGFEPALRTTVLPPTHEVPRGNDENPSSEFGGLVSYFSSQQEDDFDA